MSSIYQLIPDVMAEIGAIGKNRRNEQQKYAFRGIEDFYQAAHPAMVKHKIFCAPEVLERDVYRFEKTNDQGRVTTWVHVSLKVKHHFYAPDGSSVPVTTCGEGLDNSDKATNKAMSVAMKYALIELFCVPTEDIEDADRTTPEAGTKRMNGNGNGKPVERTTEEIPLQGRALPPAADLIDDKQCAKLYSRFRESLSAEIRAKLSDSEQDALLREWLGNKLYLDANGNPSAGAIRKDEFATVGKSAVGYAKGL